jgi:transposase-like protein
MKQKKYSVEEKMAVVLALMKGQKTVSQICKEYVVSNRVV